MTDLAFVQQLSAVMAETGTTTLRVTGPGIDLTLTRSTTVTTAPKPVAAPQRQHAKSPGLGHFRPRGEDDGLPPLTEGQAVQQGEILGFVCDDGLLQPVLSPCAGRPIVCHATPGQLVGYADVLFDLEPDA